MKIKVTMEIDYTDISDLSKDQVVQAVEWMLKDTLTDGFLALGDASETPGYEITEIKAVAAPDPIIHFREEIVYLGNPWYCGGIAIKGELGTENIEHTTCKECYLKHSAIPSKYRMAIEPHLKKKAVQETGTD